MRVEILGAESLGVRGLACLVVTADRQIVIDPGLALGYERHGLLPHPVQVAAGEDVRRRILDALKGATDVVLSHIHGDHVPMPDPNPYQLGAADAGPLMAEARLWAKGTDGLSDNMARRRTALVEVLGRDLPAAEGIAEPPFMFSRPVPHGEPGTPLGTVMMTRIEDADTVFVHASDIELLDGEAVDLIVKWKPTVVLAGGPPLYRQSFTGAERRERAWRLGLQLARATDTLMLDHHLLRSEEGARWLDRLASESGRRVVCAADFMGRPRRLLEARREELYRRMPVVEGWHEAYARGEVDCEEQSFLVRKLNRMRETAKESV